MNCRSSGIYLLITTLLAISGCGSKGEPIEFVLPRDFRGPVWLVIRSSATPIPWVQDGYQVVVPDTGVVYFRSLAPFERWHKESARFAGAGPLRVFGNGDPDPDTIMLMGGSRVSQQANGRTIEYMTYYVGTIADWKAWTNSSDAGKIPD